MKKHILLILSLLFYSVTYSQYYEMLGSQREYIIENFSESNGFSLLDSNKNEMQFTYVFDGDTTSNFTYFFGTEWLDQRDSGTLRTWPFDDVVCTKIIWEFFCDKCAEKNIACITNDKGEWIESESNYYVSKKRLGFDLSFAKDRESIVKTMRVTNTPNQNVKTTILFKMETMRTKTWKELIK